MNISWSNCKSFLDKNNLSSNRNTLTFEQAICVGFEVHMVKNLFSFIKDSNKLLLAYLFKAVDNVKLNLIYYSHTSNIVLCFWETNLTYCLPRIRTIKPFMCTKKHQGCHLPLQEVTSQPLLISCYKSIAMINIISFFL